MAIFTPQLSILPPVQRALWAQLRVVTELGYVLYGGTAIALRLGHRTSVDFDFFTDKPLDKTALRANIGFLEQAQLLQDQPDTLTVNLIHDAGFGPSVKLSFFGAIDFGRYSEPDITDDGILQVAALDDLMATKLKVMLQRIEAKDYRDIAAMLKIGQRLDLALAIARAMFGNEFQPSESLKSLTWFEGGDLSQLTDEEKQTLINAAAAVRQLPKVKKADNALALKTHP